MPPSTRPPAGRLSQLLILFALTSAAGLNSMCAPLARAAVGPRDFFAIRVVDADTGRGVPLVELRTTYEQSYFTDSAGYIAFLEPGLTDGRDLWFDVRSYGYESPKGPLGTTGLSLKPAPGKAAQIKLKRTQIAERLYRVTGYGVYRDSVLLGKKPPIKEPLLNARVTGQDTVQTAVYKGKYLWFWQDTDQAGFALGGFSMTGATADAVGKADPEAGINFDYFVDKPGDFARPAARIPIEGTHPVWIDGLTVVPDEKGTQHLVGRYAAVNADFSPVEVGLVLWNDDKQIFERLKKFANKGNGTLAPTGRPFYFNGGGGGGWGAEAGALGRAMAGCGTSDLATTCG